MKLLKSDIGILRNVVNMDRETWLSGIGRASFHWSSTRETYDGKTIFFDASKLFE